MIRIPSRQGGAWNISHGQELSADLINTRAMDFERQGRAMLARLPIALQTSIESANLGLPLAIPCDGTNYYIITNAGVWQSSDGITITQLTTTNQPTLGFQSDGIIYNGVLVVSGTTSVKSYAAGVWTDRISGLSSSYPHALCVLEGSNRLAVTDGNVVHQYDTSWTEDTSNKLTIPSEYIAVWVRYRENKAQIGTRNVSGRDARLFLWTGSGVGAQASYGVQASWIYAACEYLGSTAIITSAGQLLRFTGAGFEELAHLPVYELPYSWTSASSPATAVGKVHQRGMAANGHTLYINIDGSLHRNGVDYPGNILPTQPSGLWEYNPKNGLHHKAGYVYSKYLTLTPTAVSSSVLSFASDHQALTGDAVHAKTISGLTGLVTNQAYYAIKQSETTLKLALSPADALAGRAITLAGSPSTDAFCFNTYNSIGSVSDMTPGAVAMFTNVSFYDFFGLEVLYGGRCQDQTDTTRSTFMSLGLGRNVGSFDTAPIYSADVTETFHNFYEHIRTLALDTDKIVLKTRTSNRFGMPTPALIQIAGKATWVDASTFTIDSRYKDVKSVLSGDEVLITAGPGAGRTAHLTADPSVGADGYTYTFSLDETIPLTQAGYLSEVIIDNWEKLETTDNARSTIGDGYAQKLVYKDGPWAQFRVELRGKYVSLTHLSISTTVKKLAT